MNFSEKLFKLRKEKGFSQEALAEQLNTSRQAISKWENDQGFPETEKLLMLGNIFNVSIDYLLKDSAEKVREDEEGYYVSTEMAEGYLMQERKISKFASLGITLVALSFLPYFILSQNTASYAFIIIALAAVGIVIYVAALSIEKSQYKILKKKPLLFDEKYLGELRIRYELIKKKYFISMVLSGICFILGVIPFLLENKNITAGILVPYYPFFIIMIAIGVYIFIRIMPILEAYKLFVDNDEHVSKLSFKLKRKARKKVDEF